MQNLTAVHPSHDGVRAPSINSTGVYMQKLIISLICCLLPAFAHADQLKIRDNAPDRHIVVKGDTLWDISEKFFEDPWKWPQIWGFNKDSIKDPHWIYPGDVIVLDRATGTLRIASETDATTTPPDDEQTASSGSDQTVTPGVSGDAVKLSPRIQFAESKHGAIPSIPAEDIEPFLTRPLIIEKGALANAPAIVGTLEKRVLLGNNDIAYVKGLDESEETTWQIYRTGKTFLDPDTKELLGHEAIYLGEAKVEKFADISTTRITKSVQEVTKGDRLVRPAGEILNNYMPHAPASQISARVISIYNGVSLGGQYMVITLNKGNRDGLEKGHVLALYRKGETVKEQGQKITLPDVRYGLAFVFRTFDKLSYALVMQVNLPVYLMDSAQTP